MLARTLTGSVALEIISAGGLWKCNADKSELETVLLNLVINADHAMASKGKLTIEAYNARLNRAIGMLICSRYFATVRRATG